MNRASARHSQREGHLRWGWLGEQNCSEHLVPITLYMNPQNSLGKQKEQCLKGHFERGQKESSVIIPFINSLKSLEK